MPSQVIVRDATISVNGHEFDVTALRLIAPDDEWTGWKRTLEAWNTKGPTGTYTYFPLINIDVEAIALITGWTIVEASLFWDTHITRGDN